MKIKNFLIVFLISILTITKIPQAEIISLQNTYKQGIYDISNFAGRTGVVKLITPDKPVVFIEVDRSGMLKSYSFIDDDKEQITAGPVAEGDKMIIVGGGEVVISPLK
ncbi:MAG: hypothetical protein ABRQ25_17525 [Clostridiaceae bacterium]